MACKDQSIYHLLLTRNSLLTSGIEYGLKQELIGKSSFPAWSFTKQVINVDQEEHVIWEFQNMGLMPSTIFNSPYNSARPYSSPILVILYLNQVK